MEDQIVKTVELKASVDRVWSALTDHEQFGKWFGVRLDGPWVVGEVTTGQITVPGYEHMRWETETKTLEPKTMFSFTFSKTWS